MKITTKLTVFAALVTLIAVAGCQNPLEPSSSGYSVSDQPDYRYTNAGGDDSYFPTLEGDPIFRQADNKVTYATVAFSFPKDKNLDILRIEDKTLFDAEVEEVIEFYNLTLVADANLNKWGSFSERGSAIDIVGVDRSDNVVHIRLDANDINSEGIVAVVKAATLTVNNGQRIDRNGDGVIDRLSGVFDYDDKLFELTTGLTMDGSLVGPNSYFTDWNLSFDWYFPVDDRTSEAYIDSVSFGAYPQHDPNSDDYEALFASHVTLQELNSANTWVDKSTAWNYDDTNTRYVLEFEAADGVAYRLLASDMDTFRAQTAGCGYIPYYRPTVGQEDSYTEGYVASGPRVRNQEDYYEIGQNLSSMLSTNNIFYNDTLNYNGQTVWVLDIAREYKFEDSDAALIALAGSEIHVIRSTNSSLQASDLNDPQFVDFTLAIRNDPTVVPPATNDYERRRQLVITLDNYKIADVNIMEYLFLVFSGDIQAQVWSTRFPQTENTWNDAYLGDVDLTSSYGNALYKGYKVQATGEIVPFGYYVINDNNTWWNMVASSLQDAIDGWTDMSWDQAGNQFIAGFNNAVSLGYKLTDAQAQEFYNRYTYRGYYYSDVINEINSGNRPNFLD